MHGKQFNLNSINSMMLLKQKVNKQDFIPVILLRILRKHVLIIISMQLDTVYSVMIAGKKNLKLQKM